MAKKEKRAQIGFKGNKDAAILEQFGWLMCQNLKGKRIENKEVDKKNFKSINGKKQSPNFATEKSKKK